MSGSSYVQTVGSRAAISAELKRQRGWLIPCFALSLATLLGFIGLSVDVGVTYFSQRRLHMAADAAAFAAARLLPASNSTVQNEVNALMLANGVSLSEITAIQCGSWQNGSFNAAGSCSQSGVDAVRVRAARSVLLRFARAVGVSSLAPTVSAIARRTASNPAYCVRPIGLQLSYVQQFYPGNLLVIDNVSSGNWGKLDIGGQMSSGNNFQNAMLNPSLYCRAAVAPNSSVGTGTGFGGSMSNVLGDVIQQGLGTGMILPVTSAFPNGNGSVTVFSYAKVNLIGQQGNGQNWQATLQLVEYPTTPPTNGGNGIGGNRQMVM